MENLTDENNPYSHDAITNFHISPEKRAAVQCGTTRPISINVNKMKSYIWLWTLRSRVYLFAARFHLCCNHTSTISLSYSFHISKTNCSSIIIDTCRCVCTSIQRAAMRMIMVIYILILTSLLIVSFRELCNIHRPDLFTLHNAILLPSLYTLPFCYVFVSTIEQYWNIFYNVLLPFSAVRIHSKIRPCMRWTIRWEDNKRE